MAEGKGTIQVLARALTILNLIGQSKEPLSLTSVVKLSGMSKSTVHRILKDLVLHQYISVDRHSEYVLGTQLVCLGARALGTGVAAHGLDVARNLYEATRLTVCVCSLSEFEVVYLLKFAPRVTIKQDVGSIRPAYSTALGKCMLAQLPNVELDHLIQLHGLPRLTENTICEIDVFKQELRLTRDRGFAINRHEANPQVDGVAAPIFDFRGRCVAAISVACIVPLQDKDILTYAGAVQEAAAAISHRMGYSVADNSGV